MPSRALRGRQRQTGRAEVHRPEQHALLQIAQSESDRAVRRAALRALGKPAIVYFYPKDDTPGCTAEACSFRDHYEVLKAAGAEVVGVSSDDVHAHEAFGAKYQLPFVLLSDPGGQVRASYGVKRSLGLIDGRITFVIDRRGIVRHAFSSQLRPKKHVDEALRILQSLQ